MHLIKSIAVGLLLAAPAFGTIRVLPLGDSLTVGVGSAEMGGYRQIVKANLGNKIDFIGRKQDGPFQDNQDEGWGGFTIDMIREQVVPTVPNYTGFGETILLTTGTNEFVWTQNPTEDGALTRANAALARMRNLLQSTVDLAGYIQIYVSTIPAIRDWNHPENTYTYPEVDIFNAGLPGLVNEFRAQEYDMRFVDTTSTLNLQTDFYDGIHPNDAGYAKIGNAWTAALTPEPASSAVVVGAVTMLATRRQRRARHR
jgi:lysophospholipase L1-like esterase